MQRMIRVALAAALLLLCCLPAAAVSVDDLVRAVKEEIPEDELLEPGSTALPERLAEMLEEDFGLDEQQRRELKLRVGEAWLGAWKPDAAEVIFSELLAAEVSDAIRQRIGMGVVAAWELRRDAAEDPSELPPAEQALARYGEFPAPVQARARVVEAERLLTDKPETAIGELDRALELLATADERQRVPIYALRIIAMENAGVEGDEIQEWLVSRGEDPAVAHVLASLLTAGQKLIGREAPALHLPRIDGQEGAVDLAELRGEPVLLYFFATWCKPCATVSPVVVRIAAARDDVAILGISLDNRDTVKNLPDYRARYGIDFPVVGELQGWDGEIDDQYHVEAIPHLVLIDAAGRIAGTELVGVDEESTAARLRKALDFLQQGPVDDDPDGVVVP